MQKLIVLSLMRMRLHTFCRDPRLTAWLIENAIRQQASGQKSLVTRHAKHRLVATSAVELGGHRITHFHNV